MNIDRVKSIIGENNKFQNPYTSPESYYIWDNEDDSTEICKQKHA